MKNLTDFRKTVENGMDPRLIAQENVNTVLTSRFFAVRDEFTSFNHWAIPENIHTQPRTASMF